MLGLPLVVIGVSFDEAFKNAELLRAEKKARKIAKRLSAGHKEPVQAVPLKEELDMDQVRSPSTLALHP
eukprot:SAG11_NODE_129_length_15500_cov_16.145250_4_plen_69_part_00